MSALPAASFQVTPGELAAFHREGGLEGYQKFGGLKAVLESLRVNIETGIANDVEERRRVFGANRIPEKPAKSYLAYIWDGLQDFTIQLLCVCALVSIVIAVTLQREEELSWMEGTTILITVAIVCNIQAGQDYAKERSFRKLNAEVSNILVPIFRGGQKLEVLRYDLVVGDIVTIGVGDILEADGLLMRGDDIECDESALTGEPEDLKKDPTDAPFCFSGTSVKNGSGQLLVTAVGVYSMSGKITALIRGQKVGKDQVEDEADAKAVAVAESEGSAEVKEEAAGEGGADEDGSVLRAKLDLLAGRIAYLAFAAAGLASVVMLVYFLIDNYGVQGRGWEAGRDETKILDALVTGIAIVVVAVPEGLPLAVTLSLSLSVKKMQKDNNLVKHLDATETMGSATTICSDKTGTLTQNRMTVMKTYVGGKEFAGELSNTRTCGKLMKEANILDSGVATKLTDSICLTRAEGTDISWDQEADRWEQKGNKTDCALLALAYDTGVDHKQARSKEHYYTKDKNGNLNFGLKIYPFSSSRKRSAQAIPLETAGHCRLFVKGASEMILKLATCEVRLDGSSVELTSVDRERIHNDVINKFASGAMRTIGLAYRDFTSPPDWDEELSEADAQRLTGQVAKTFCVETDLTLIGICGINDPIRDGVPRAIMQCNNAGVDVRMVTGDHKATAIAIAKECGILRRGVDYKDGPGETLVNKYTAMTGEEFRSLVTDSQNCIKQKQFDEVWPYLRVLARSSPEDKHSLVSGLCESNLFATEVGRMLPIYPDKQVVAVTGDGTNDAPALRRAHVGFAMKITGTRVAQDAADILLLDDNFASVVKACMWGRNVYDSIAKFLQFQLTVNISAVTISVLCALVIQEVPLSVVQMLWVNLIMDSLGALALASEPPTEDLLKRAPYGRNRGLISFPMRCNMIGQSVYQLIVLLAVIFGAAGPRCPGDKDPKTWVFEKGGFLDIESGIGRDHHADPTEHYTVVFNIFVFMQLFNWINCRKLYHEWNAFEGIHNNLSFIFIWTACLIVQILLVEGAAMGGGSGTNKALKTQALDGEKWGLCLACGCWSIIWQLIVIVGGRFLKPILWKEQEWYPITVRSGSKDQIRPEEANGAETETTPPGKPEAVTDEVITVPPIGGLNTIPRQLSRTEAGASSPISANSSRGKNAGGESEDIRRPSKLGSKPRAEDDKNMMTTLSSRAKQDEKSQRQSLHRTLSKGNASQSSPGLNPTTDPVRQVSQTTDSVAGNPTPTVANPSLIS